MCAPVFTMLELCDGVSEGGGVLVPLAHVGFYRTVEFGFVACEFE
jgi:hypothetical protein